MDMKINMENSNRYLKEEEQRKEGEIDRMTDRQTDIEGCKQGVTYGGKGGITERRTGKTTKSGVAV